jgi:hypothetical protein
MQYQPLVLQLERGGSSAVGRGRAGDNRPDHDHYRRLYATLRMRQSTEFPFT